MKRICGLAALAFAGPIEAACSEPFPGLPGAPFFA
jgi:hypothetical protein